MNVTTMSSLDTRVPVSLLTGFLGAGKTTLLNQLVLDQDAGRIAVIMNEFGAAGLDHDLLEASVEEIILMQSGCLCCTFRGDISNTLRSLLERRERREVFFDRVVIETTGIADPGPILHTLVVDNLIAPHYRIDGVITVADSATGLETLNTHFEAANQIAVADLIVVTKADLVERDRSAAFEESVKNLNNTAPLVYAEHGRVPQGSLFNLSAMHEDAASDDVSRWLGDVDSKHERHGKEESPNPESPVGSSPASAHSIVSKSLEISAPIPPSTFQLWLDFFVALKGPDILRMKGIIHIKGMERPFVIHGVQHIFDAPVPLSAWSGNDETSRIVVIARNMSEGHLNDNLAMLIQSKPDDTAKIASERAAESTEVSLQGVSSHEISV